MRIMLAKTYAALKAAGAPEEEAQPAAEELVDSEARFVSRDSRLGSVETGLDLLRPEIKTRFAVLTWAVGINTAATIAILGVLFRH
jgi:hypothetical protein